MKRFVLAALILVGALASPQRLAAQSVPTLVGAEAFVKDLADRAIGTAAATGTPDNERTRLFRELFTSSFDVPTIGRFVLSRHWRAASEQEKKEFLALFEDVTVLTWAGRFKDYKGQTLAVKGSIPGDDGVIIVKSVVEQKEGQPLTVNWMVTWSLTQGSAGYRIRDLVVDGVSMAITYRSDYTSVIQHADGKIEGLLKVLRAKIAQLEASPGAVQTP